jgi:hypothetical protein
VEWQGFFVWVGCKSCIDVPTIGFGEHLKLDNQHLFFEKYGIYLGVSGNYYNTPKVTVNLTLHQYKEILSTALDHRLKYLKGKLLFDDRDPAAEQDKILRADLDKYVEQNNRSKLDRMLKALIEGFFAFHDEYDFSKLLYDKAGYRITPIPKEHVSLSTRRTLHLSVAGTGDHSITTLQILLPTDSGILYSARGSFPNMKAEWKGRDTIEIEVPATTEEFDRVSKVIYHGETIQIVYKESSS